MPPEDDLRAEIQRAYERVESEQAAREQIVDKATEKPIPVGTIRFRITSWVVGAYLFYAIAVGIFIMVYDDAAKAASLIDIMKTLLLPIVTLVIGYYFGASRPE